MGDTSSARESVEVVDEEEAEKEDGA